MSIHLHVVTLALCAALWPQASATQSPSRIPSKRMPDGKEWTTANIGIATPSSFCYDDDERNCRRYGRLYTWDAAQGVCPALGDRWRLPTNDEWRAMVKHYGGVRDDSADGGKAAFVALIAGGPSGFEVVYGGGREAKGGYARGDAHGFYWTATESGAGTAWLYNLGRNGQIVNRHENGEKASALAVRCVRD